MKKTLVAVACLACIGTAGSAMAYEFSMGGASSVTGDAFSDPGLVMSYEINPGLSAITSNLNVGESDTFLFATFWTTEGWVNSDDEVAQSMTANVDFDDPDLFGYVGGESVGFSYLSGFFQGWSITWEDPVQITFGPDNSGSFTLSLSDAIFGTAFWQGPDGACWDHTADVYATITLDSEPVPEPATMLLFGVGLTGLAGIRARKQTKK